MQDDNAMNGTHAEIRKLKADLAQAERDREFWHGEANCMAALLAQEQTKKSSSGAKLYGRSEALRQVSENLMTYHARRAFEAGEMINPSEIRDIALQIRKEADADLEYGKELDRIAQDGGE